MSTLEIVTESQELVIAGQFKRFHEQAAEWKAQCAVVTDVKIARASRLALKKIRVEAGHKHEELKKDVLARGRLIDSALKEIEGVITPLEKQMEEIEKAEERAEAARKAKLKAEREELLKPYNVNTAFYALGEMPEADFQILLGMQKAAFEAAQAAAKKAEADRLAAEKAKAEEEAKIRAENERLKREAFEAAKREEEARKAQAEKEAALRAEQARIEAEAKRKQQEADAKAKAERDAIEAKAKEEREKLIKKQKEEQAKLDAARREAEAKAKAAQDEARKLREAEEARTRKLIASLTAALTSAKTDAANWSERWESVSPHIQAAQSVTASVKSRSLAQIVDSAVNEIENPKEKRTIATGFSRWDLAAGPFRAGELITIAARPGCGKTALGVQIADFATKTGLGIIFFSLEMSGEELVNRIALRRAGVSALMNPREKIKHLEDLAKIKTFHIFDNAERQTLSSIEARSRLIAGSPNGLGLIVVDYLQLVTPSETRAPREQQVAEMSRRFKELAGALKVPVVILAQLNRESEKEERMPRLSDLRESGAIEQDSDRVWFLYQDSKNTPKMEEQPDNIVVSLIQAKCRGGKPWLITDMEFRRPLFQFVPVQR